MIALNLLPLLPELFLSIAAMGLLMVGVTRGNNSTAVITGSAIIALGMTLIVSLGIERTPVKILENMIIFDGFAGSMKILIILGLMTVLLLSVKYLEQESIARFEFPVLVLFAGLGMMIMVSAHNFLSLYMGLELQSLSLYVLAAFHRGEKKSSEAGVKYFVLGALSSGMLLYGISLLYGFSGTLDFETFNYVLQSMGAVPMGAIIGLVFILAALAFKISIVPFHMWTPDVYQGAPTAVTALFAIVPKLAAIALLMRLSYGPFSLMTEQWTQVLYFAALASMLLGAFAGIAQNDIKRLMAYSSIGHMGYALIGLVTGTEDGAGALVLYMLIYMVMSAGTFAVILSVRRNGLALYRISDLAGLSKTAPILAYTMAIMMFSMAGIPPMAGFFGKLAIFQAAVANEMYVLATLGILTSVVAAYYYLRIIKIMFFEDPSDDIDHNVPFARRLLIYLSLAFVLGFVAKPSFISAFAVDAVQSLFAG